VKWCSVDLATGLDYHRSMATVDLHALGHDSFSLLERIESGETLRIMHGGRAVAELRPVDPPASVPRPIGLCAGEFVVPDDFDSPLPDELLREFEGS
jgi:antitoxin (DNA-binding transcriptional repressor) of toxin-antitoxin stability system